MQIDYIVLSNVLALLFAKQFSTHFNSLKLLALVVSYWIYVLYCTFRKSRTARLEYSVSYHF